MEEKHRELFKTNLVFLLDNLQPDAMTDHLVEVRLLSDHDLEAIRLEQTQNGKIRIIIDRIQRKGPTAFERFIDVLKKTDQEFVAAKLLEGISTKPVSTVTNNTDSDGTQAASEDKHAGTIDSFLQERGCTIWNYCTDEGLSELERRRTREKITRIDRPKTIDIDILDLTSLNTDQEKITVNSSEFVYLYHGETRKILDAKKRNRLKGETRRVPLAFRNCLDQLDPVEVKGLVDQARYKFRRTSTTNAGGLVSGQAGVVSGQENGLPGLGFDYGKNRDTSTPQPAKKRCFDQPHVVDEPQAGASDASGSQLDTRLQRQSSPQTQSQSGIVHLGSSDPMSDHLKVMVTLETIAAGADIESSVTQDPDMEVDNSTKEYVSSDITTKHTGLNSRLPEVRVDDVQNASFPMNDSSCTDHDKFEQREDSGMGESLLRHDSSAESLPEYEHSEKSDGKVNDKQTATTSSSNLKQLAIESLVESGELKGPTLMAAKKQTKEASRLFVKRLGLKLMGFGRKRKCIYRDDVCEIVLHGKIERVDNYMFKICEEKNIPPVEAFHFYMILKDVNVMYCYLTDKNELCQVKYNPKYLKEAQRYAVQLSRVFATQKKLENLQETPMED